MSSEQRTIRAFHRVIAARIAGGPVGGATSDALYGLTVDELAQVAGMLAEAYAAVTVGEARSPQAALVYLEGVGASWV